MPKLLALALLVALPASAHIEVTDPPHRTASLKEGPCGEKGFPRGEPTVYEPGETITVVFDETVDHPGWFRIMFDDAGQDDFPDPKGYDDTDPPERGLQLLRLVDDDSTRHFEVEVTLPMVTCEKCTLQVIQVMTDKPPYTSPGNDLYYQCADLALRGDVPDTDPVETDTTGADEAGTGCEGCASAGGGGAVGLLAALLPLALRRRRR